MTEDERKDDWESPATSVGEVLLEVLGAVAISAWART